MGGSSSTDHHGDGITQKYNMGIESRLQDALEIMESDDDRDVIIKRVMDSILKGKSKLKKHLSSGEINIDDVVKSMRTNRCLRTAEEDLGSTYLEQIVATAIRESMPIDVINKAREIFGLKALSKRDLVKQKGAVIKSRQQGSEPPV